MPPHARRPILHLLAPAKVNLCLSVGRPLPPNSSDAFAESGRRNITGYHPIASWFEPIRLFDSVLLERLPDDAPSDFDVRWSIPAAEDRPVEWPLESDLTLRAHRLLERHAGRTLPVRLRVSKTIPAGGGLAGGSTDAAAVLMGLAALFDLPADAQTLRDLSMHIGSDIAFFIDEDALLRLRTTLLDHATNHTRIEPLSPRPALVTGLGERIERIHRALVPTAELLLFLPPFGCPTAAVYRAFDANPHDLREDLVRNAIDRARALRRVDPASLFNDLTPAARSAVPELAALIDALQRALSLPIHMSGSGSTLFALAPTADDLPFLAAQRAAAALNVRCVHSQLLS